MSDENACMMDTGDDSVLPDNELGALNPLYLLPPEMWDSAMKLLDDPMDFVNVTRTCTLFEGILTTKKGAYELEVVLPLLFKWLPETDVLTLRHTCNRIRCVTDRILNECGRVYQFTGTYMFPRLMSPAQRKQLSSPGAVSHEWSLFGNGILDNFSVQLGPHPDKLKEFCHEMEPVWRQPTGNPFVCKKLFLTFLDRNRIAQIMQHRDDANIAGVAVNVNEPFPVVDPDFLRRSLEMLTSCSEKLCTLKVRVPFDGIGLVELYDIFRQICGAVKDNLRCMAALFRLALFDLTDPTAWNTMAEAQVTRLESHIQENPLPAMKQLDEIHLPISLVHYPITHEVIQRYSPQLTSLRLGLLFYNMSLRVFREPPNVYKSIEKNAYAFPNLRNLRLEMSWFEYDKICSRIEAPQLTQLWLHLNDHNGFCTILPEVKLREVVLKYPSLVSLHLEKLEFRRATPSAFLHLMQQVSHGSQLNHGALRHLSINEWNHDLPLKFFTEMIPNVKTIKICIDRLLRTAMHNIGITDGTLLRDKKMYESQIWKERPSLESIRFECSSPNQLDFYDRREYKNLQRKTQSSGTCITS